ncbi:MAG TPA: LUD domain-containing protein [Acidobacteriaceae bacterium]|nr:LUD domain-containing protein [Acidobacteriaceae bacterium]
MPEAARSAIVERIANANRGVDAGAREAEYEAIERGYQTVAEMDRTAILATFVERLREYDAQVHEVGPADVAEAVRAAMAQHGQRSAVVSNGFPREWLPRGFELRTEADTSTDAMSATEGALVTCEVAIAHTGTIVLKNSRRLTLLPDRLVCVVRTDQVVETVPEAFARLQGMAADALTFISGPSATADIEMTRIRGVHGPRYLDVVIAPA